ncbi:MAG: biotin--[acetyl-CoA-carboxylase] ligase [Saprospiraceae bacterium]|nr:biotin--[acetyl-CoA-carboxylase] ligase [Saprospiraceae bacterium]
MHPNNTLFVGKVLLRHSILPSTNSFLLDILTQKNWPEGITVQTDHQTEGRGQLGNSWYSSPNANITLSTALFPHFAQPKDTYLFTKMAALAVRDVVEEFVGQRVWVKWPNDIILNHKKICGILLQSALSGFSIQHLVVGVGINVNEPSFPASLPLATSMYLETGIRYNLDAVRDVFFKRLEQYYLRIKAQHASEIHQAFHSALYLRNQPAQFKRQDASVFTGTIIGVDHHGRLLIKSGTGTEHFDVKEIKWIPPTAPK